MSDILARYDSVIKLHRQFDIRPEALGGVRVESLPCLSINSLTSMISAPFLVIYFPVTVSIGCFEVLVNRLLEGVNITHVLYWTLVMVVHASL